MTAYLLAHARFRPPLHEDVLTYLESVQATMDPFGGRFLIQGAPPDVREGEWEDDVVLLEFPDLDSANAWYESPAYNKIKHLRTDHVPGTLMLIEGCAPDHDSAARAAALRR